MNRGKEPSNSGPHSGAYPWWPPKTEGKPSGPAFWEAKNSAELSFSGAQLSNIKAGVARAMQLGWMSIEVDGAPEFRRVAWMSATAMGLKVTNFNPTPQDAAMFQELFGEVAAPGADISASGSVNAMRPAPLRKPSGPGM